MLDLARRLTDEDNPIELVGLKEAREFYKDFRVLQGAPATKGPAPKLLTPPTANAKLGKGLKNGIHEFGLSLAPAMLSQLYNVCRFSSPECRKGCVAFAGHGEMPWVIKARVIKTLFLAEYPSEFMTMLFSEIDHDVWRLFERTARLRLNNFSDIPWEEIKVEGATVFERFPRLRFYDYTKWGQRALDANLGAWEWPGNYRLTMSASEMTSDDDIVHQVNEGVNTAVLFDVQRGQPLPSMWKGARVIDGDEHDDRWLDPNYVVVGLRAKGRMRLKKFETEAGVKTSKEWKMVRRINEGDVEW